MLQAPCPMPTIMSAFKNAPYLNIPILACPQKRHNEPKQCNTYNKEPMQCQLRFYYSRKLAFYIILFKIIPINSFRLSIHFQFFFSSVSITKIYYQLLTHFNKQNQPFIQPSMLSKFPTLMIRFVMMISRYRQNNLFSIQDR